jgi:hypothetical protein
MRSPPCITDARAEYESCRSFLRICALRPNQTCTLRRCEQSQLSHWKDPSKKRRGEEDFTEVILRNPLFQDLDPTIQGLPWDPHVVFLTRETGKQTTWAGIIIQANLGIGRRP